MADEDEAEAVTVMGAELTYEPINEEHLVESSATINEEPADNEDPAETPAETPEEDAPAASPAEKVITSAPSTAPTMQVTSQWSDYLKRAVANVEQTIDKALQDGPTAEVNISRPASTPMNSGGRLSMQERLAMAVGRNTPQVSTSGENTPRQSIDNARESEESSEVNTKEASQRSSLDKKNVVFSGAAQIELSISLARKLYDVVQLLDIPTDQDEVVKSSFVELINELELQGSKYNEEKTAVSERITNLEEKLSYLSKQEVERANLAKKNASSSSEKKIAERDAQIALLFEEGQMMSKKELVHMNTIKKLRQQEREHDKVLDNTSKKTAKLENEVIELKDKIKMLKDNEKIHFESSKIITKVESEIGILKNEKSDLQAKLEKLEKEFKALKEKNDEELIATQTVALKEANEKSESLQKSLEKTTLDFQLAKEQDDLYVAELKSQLERDSQSSIRIQTELREEIKNLEAKVEYFRSLTEESHQRTINDSQVNFVQQMENLRTQHSIASENWQRIESSLLGRISSLEKDLEEKSHQEHYTRNKLKSVTENYREQSEVFESLNEKNLELETSVEKFKAKAASSNEQIDKLKQQLEKFSVEYQQLKDQFDTSKSALESKVEVLKQEIQTLKSNRSGAVSPLHVFTHDNNSRKSMSNGGQEVFSDSFGRSPYSPSIDHSLKLQKNTSNSLFSSTESVVTGGLVRSPSGQSFYTESRDYFFDDQFNQSASRRNTVADISHSRDSKADNNSSIHTLNAGPSMQLMGKMNTAIRRLESELASVRQDLLSMTKSKDEACQEVLTLMRENDQLSSYRKKSEELEASVKALEVREQTTLEMLGERSELVQELRADVDDLKTMYRQQIEELVDRLAKAKQ